MNEVDKLDDFLQGMHPHFFLSEDQEKIFFITNFKKINLSQPVIIFNYGLVCSHLHWKYQVSFFTQMGYQVLLHDYRGHFRSSGKDQIDKITFKQVAKDIADLCDFLKIKKSILIGHSMGVNVCLQFAKDYPSHVEKMILISGTFLNVQDVMFDSNIMDFIAPLAEDALKKYPEIFRKIWSLSGKNRLVQEIIHLTGFNKKQVPKEFIDLYLNRVGELGADLFFQLFKEMSQHHLTGYLEQMNIPSLVIGGYRDYVIPNHIQRTLASLLPLSETYFLKDGSHVPQADFPELINERIDIFLRK